METTGLPKSFTAPLDQIDNWPRVIQIAWMIFDHEGDNIKRRNFIIFPKDFNIPDSSIAIHGITLDRAEKEGILMNKILERFNDDLIDISTIIAHNIEFDLPTLNAEFLRTQIKTDLLEKQKFCTMKTPQIISFCKIPNPYREGYKWPTLPELHKILFNESFVDAHDASADVEACARCYFEIKKRGILNE
ncbi:MAG: 3'-5' exonuclease [Methanoregula sp.]